MVNVSAGQPRQVYGELRVDYKIVNPVRKSLSRPLINILRDCGVEINRPSDIVDRRRLGLLANEVNEEILDLMAEMLSKNIELSGKTFSDHLRQFMKVRPKAYEIRFRPDIWDGIPVKPELEVKINDFIFRTVQQEILRTGRLYRGDSFFSLEETEQHVKALREKGFPYEKAHDGLTACLDVATLFAARCDWGVISVFDAPKANYSKVIYKSKGYKEPQERGTESLSARVEAEVVAKMVPPEAILGSNIYQITGRRALIST